MTNSRDIVPNIKRVISVDFMGSSRTLNSMEVNRLKNFSDLNNLNRIRNLSLVDNLNKLDIRESLFKDLSTQSSEIDGLKQENYETHKINPLFEYEPEEKINQKDGTSNVENIVKIDINEKFPSKNKTNITSMFEKNKMFTKERKNLARNEINKVIVKNEKFPNEDVSSVAFSNDEPIYMDPEDLIRSSIASWSEKASSIYEQETLVLDSISQNRLNSTLVSYSSSSEEDPRINSFKTCSTVFQLQIRKNSEILSQAKLLRNEMCQLYILLNIKPTDLLYNLVIVDLYHKIWIGNLFSPIIGNILHFGDQILNINGETPEEANGLLQMIKHSKSPVISLKLRRLPYGRVIMITGIQSVLKEDQLQINLENNVSLEILKEIFGIRLKLNTAKIEKIYESGFFYKNGLKYDPNKVSYELENTNKMFTLNRSSQNKDRLSKWVITEINGDLIYYKSSAEEILARLKLNDTASIIVQPYDLVKPLFNQKKF